MIKEKYCSFKVSKLLREKGFDEPCMKVWTLDDCRESETIWSINFSESNLFVTNKELDAILKKKIFLNAAYLCPTQELVCSWLREVYSIYITVEPDINDKHCFYPVIYTMTKETWERQYFEELEALSFNSPEEAIEAALLYVLKNLI